MDSLETHSPSKPILIEQPNIFMEGSGETLNNSPQVQEVSKRNSRQSLASGAEVSSEEESSGEEPNHRVKRDERQPSELHVEVEQQGSGEQPDVIPNAVIQAQSLKQTRSLFEASTVNEGSGQEEPVQNQKFI